MKRLLSLFFACLVLALGSLAEGKDGEGAFPRVDLKIVGDQETATLVVPVGKFFFLGLRNNLTGKDFELLSGKMPSDNGPVPFLRFTAVVSITESEDDKNLLNYTYESRMDSADRLRVKVPLVEGSFQSQLSEQNRKLLVTHHIPTGHTSLDRNTIYQAGNWKVVSTTGAAPVLDVTLVFIVADSKSELLRRLHPEKELEIPQLNWDSD